jgi:hypothetical protein
MEAYNKLKFRTLSAIADRGGQWLKPYEIARNVDFVPHRSMWTYLKRLQRFGLLERRFSGRGTLEYRISTAGATRLRWLRSRGENR